MMIRRVGLVTSFDLGAFSQMVRTTNARLQRWTSQPSLVVFASVTSYRGGPGNDYSATSDQMSDAELSGMVAHLIERLSRLTGKTFTSFGSVTFEHPGSGERVIVDRPGQIVVRNYNGIVSIASTIRYGTWAETPDDSVVGGRHVSRPRVRPQR